MKTKRSDTGNQAKNVKRKVQNENVKQKIELKARAYTFALRIIKFIDGVNNQDFAVNVISKQLLRSATSIGANIIEAQAGSSKKDFTNFFSHALKSANETKFWIALLRDSNKADRAGCSDLLQEATELSNILGSSIITLRGKR